MGKTQAELEAMLIPQEPAERPCAACHHPQIKEINRLISLWAERRAKGQPTLAAKTLCRVIRDEYPGEFNGRKLVWSKDLFRRHAYGCLGIKP